MQKTMMTIFLVSVFQLAQEFASFGSVDVKILDSQHALVAVAQHRKQVYEILRKGFKKPMLSTFIFMRIWSCVPRMKE